VSICNSAARYGCPTPAVILTCSLECGGSRCRKKGPISSSFGWSGFLGDSDNRRKAPFESYGRRSPNRQHGMAAIPFLCYDRFFSGGPNAGTETEARSTPRMVAGLFCALVKELPARSRPSSGSVDVGTSSALLIQRNREQFSLRLGLRLHRGVVGALLAGRTSL